MSLGDLKGGTHRAGRSDISDDGVDPDLIDLTDDGGDDTLD